jgi:hypothetical protein
MEAACLSDMSVKIYQDGHAIEFHPADNDIKYNFFYIYDLLNGDVTSSYNVERQDDCSDVGIHRLILTFRRSIIPSS